MANKSIKELPKATQIQEDDALPMQQGTTTKQVTGLTLTLWLLGMADGHGGVTDFQKLSESGLEKTYQFTMADTTKYTFTVTDGNGVADFQQSVSGLVHTYKLIMDNGQEYTMTIKDGEKGDKGDAANLWYKFASEKPTSSSSSMGDEPDAWMGVHSGHEATAPTDPMDYTWVRVLGDTGPTGAPATLIRSTVEYQVGTSATVEPSGNWSEAIPAVPQGSYLWSRTTIQFNTGGIIQILNKSRDGLDGLGSVVSVNNISPGENGNVELTADDVGAVPKSGGTMEGPLHMNGQVLDGLNDPTEPDEAVRKAYADKKLALEGGTMEGPIHMNGQPITGLNDPTDGTDAVRKSYVDTNDLNTLKYASPANLLDNSYFRYPVAQAGIGGNHGNQAYAVDRWILTNGSVSHQEGVGLTLNGTITQKLEHNPIFNAQAFVGMASGQASISYSDGAVTITSSGGVIAWAALYDTYENVYSEQVLPEYHPKGYGAELAECQRYFISFDGANSVALTIAGYVSGGSTLATCAFFVPVPMRITPTVYFSGYITMRGIDGYSSDAGANVAAYQNPVITANVFAGRVCSLAFAKRDGSAWGNIVNNTPVTVNITGTASLALSADL